MNPKFEKNKIKVTFPSSGTVISAMARSENSRITESSNSSNFFNVLRPECSKASSKLGISKRKYYQFGSEGLLDPKSEQRDICRHRKNTYRKAKI